MFCAGSWPSAFTALALGSHFQLALPGPQYLRCALRVGSGRLSLGTYSRFAGACAFILSEMHLLPHRHALTIRTSAKRQQIERAQRLLTRASTGEDSVKGATGNPSDHQGMTASTGGAQVDCKTGTLHIYDTVMCAHDDMCYCRELSNQQHQHLVSKACKTYQSIPKSL